MSKEGSLTIGEIMQLMDGAAKVLALGPLTGDRVGWLTYLLEAFENELDDQAEAERVLSLLRVEIDGRLERGGW